MPFREQLSGFVSPPRKPTKTPLTFHEGKMAHGTKADRFPKPLERIAVWPAVEGHTERIRFQHAPKLSI
jgi:hypothetical protein